MHDLSKVLCEHPNRYIGPVIKLDFIIKHGKITARGLGLTTLIFFASSRMSETKHSNSPAIINVLSGSTSCQ